MNASACADPSISGGASRIASGCTALTRNPASRLAASTAPAAGPVSRAASQSPRPLTPHSSGWLVAARPVASRSPTAAGAVEAASRDAGFLVNAVQQDAIRLAPPLILGSAQADAFVAALPAILDQAATDPAAAVRHPAQTVRQEA